MANLYGERKYVIPIKNLKKALKDVWVLKKVHSVYKFNKKACLKSFTDMNRQTKKFKKYSEKDFFKLINNSVFLKKHRKLKNIGILNLLQQKKGETFSYQNQIIIQQSSSQKIY